MNRLARISARFAGLALAAALTASAPAQTADGLLFRNGDLLYGQLLGIDAQSTVRWRHPDAATPIEFKPGSVAQINFTAPANSPAHPRGTCQLLLENGDTLEGSLVSCDRQGLVLETWYAGRLNIPRAALQSLTFIPASAGVFDGITGLDGWTMGAPGAAFPGQSGKWSYRNGAFYATKPASIARDLKLPDVAEIQFDLTWKGSLNLAIAFYTDSLQPILLPIREGSPSFGGFYSLRFDNNLYRNIDLWPIKKGENFRTLGPVPFPYLNNPGHMHVDLRISKPQHKIALFVDDVLLKVWDDSAGFVGEGTGMRIVQNPGGALKLSNLRIEHWDGILMDDTESPDLAHDTFWLESGEKKTGDIQSMAGGKLTAISSNGPMEISLDKLKAVDFAHPEAAQAQTNAASVRAMFVRGGNLTFTLESWRPDEMIVRSPDFGEARFNPTAFTRLQFISAEKKPAEVHKEE